MSVTTARGSPSIGRTEPGICVRTRVFKQALTEVTRLIPARPELPVCKGVLLRCTEDALIVTAGTQWDGMSRHIGRTGAGLPDVLVDARMLRNLIAKHQPRGETTLAVDGSRVDVEQGRTHARLLTLPIDDYPGPLQPPDSGYRITADHLAAIANNVATAADTSERAFPPALADVKLEADHTNLRAVASDDQRAVVLDAPVTPVGTPEPFNVTVSAAVLRHIAAPAARHDDEITVAIGKGHLLLAARSTFAHTLLTDNGGFPDSLTSAEETPPTAVTIDRDAMITELKIITCIADRDDPVRLDAAGDRMHLEVGDDTARGESSIPSTGAGPLTAEFHHGKLTSTLQKLPPGPIMLAVDPRRGPAHITSPHQPGLRHLLLPTNRRRD